MMQMSALDELLPVVRCAEVLAQKYNVVVTNPPYMGSSGMNALLADYVKTKYPDSKSDLFACFIERCGQMVKKNGYQAMITQHAWMFLSSFEKLRAKLLAVDIVNMAHLGARAFEEIGGEVVQTTSFVIRKSHIANYKGEYCRLIEPTTQQGKEDMFLAGENRYAADQSNFSKIPGSPVAYWVSETFFNTFNLDNILSVCSQKTRISTGDNERFMRKWHEVSWTKMFSPNKWVPCCKGGDYRKWFGNIDLVLNWENDGEELSNFPKAMLGDKSYFLKPGLSWTVISSKKTSFRVVPKGTICDHKGPLIYMKEPDEGNRLLALLNSKFSEFLLQITAPTIGFEWGAVSKTPWCSQLYGKTDIDDYVNTCVTISKNDWDSYETSWDFKRNPLV